MLDEVINLVKDKLNEYKKAFIEDITYIYNINNFGNFTEFSITQEEYMKWLNEQ